MSAIAPLALCLLMVLFVTVALPALIALPPGEVSLGDIGQYTVGYQSYGQQTVLMPPDWTGHFETETGISYVPSDYVQGRPSLLLHSPWHIPPGRMFVEYTVSLPNVTPIALSFGIAMRADVAVPERSDGVTFSAYLIAEGAEQELMRYHQAEAEWKDYSFDLSDYAGRTIGLRLQVEPGPDNNSSWDYSYFGSPTLSIGSENTGEAALLAQLTSSKAYKATRNASLAACANRPGSIFPGNLLEHTNALKQVGKTWEFSYQGADCNLVYTYAPTTGRLEDFTCHLDEGTAFHPMAGAQLLFAPDPDSPDNFEAASDARLLSCQADPSGDKLVAVWEYKCGATPLELTWIFSIEGKALTVIADTDDARIRAFGLGNTAGVGMRRQFYVPYMPIGKVDYLLSEAAFACRYLDWTKTNSSTCPQDIANYNKTTEGKRNPLHEEGYVAVSPRLAEVLPNIPWQPSTYLATLGPCIMLDIWKHHDGTYAGDAANLRDLKDNGVDHAVIINHVWQRYGYDVKLPDHIPADPQFGSEEDMIEYGNAALEVGYLNSLHENYIDLYPDAPSYDPSAIVLREDGSNSPAWFNEGTQVQSWGLKCNRALGYAMENSPYIHTTYKTTAAYLDVHSCVPPWHQLDHDASQPMAAMCRLKVLRDSELFQYERDTHQGPLFGEGNNHAYWAGVVDGTEAQVNGGESHTPLLDFDLLKVHPQMVNHGMGYYERWFSQGYFSQWGFNVGTARQVDQYRAQELAYGHAGFVGSQVTDDVQWVAKEHHMMHPAQRLYGTAKVTDISYEVQGQLVPIEIALALGDTSRQRITYDSGLTLWVNWNKESWQVEGRALPQWGYLALGPGTEVFSGLRDKVLADYSECPEFLFADARTSFDMPYAHPPKQIEPVLADFQYLGGNRFQVTYEWRVNDTIPRDFHSFVHFLSDRKEARETIIFQQDHNPPVPTSQWKPGDIIQDGPYIIEAPEADTNTSYEFVIGLHSGERLNLSGPVLPGGRVLLGNLLVTREAGRITDIALDPALEVKAALGKATLDFTAGLNPAGTFVRFPKVATDGSFKLNKGDRKLVIFPYPREAAFTISLNLAELAGSPTPASVELRALAAGDQANLGPVEFEISQEWLTFKAGLTGAGRYEVTW